MKQILIVEDDPVIALGLKDNLLSAGYKVLHASDGEHGLQLALDEPIDLILLDLMLPHLSGYEICKAVRMENKEVPILMLTSKGQEEDVIRGLESGADDYITKPFSIRELMMRVRNFLRIYGGSAEEVFEFGDCRLDLGAHMFTRCGKEVELTSKEFRLLAYFVSRPGRALTRDQILNAVWGNQVLVTRRSVDRCVTTLRAKVEPCSASAVYIQTIRDVGYRFEPE